jgi:hypothetical protein
MWKYSLVVGVLAGAGVAIIYALSLQLNHPVSEHPIQASPVVSEIAQKQKQIDDELRIKAASLVPYVEGEQPRRLAEFQARLAREKDVWHFECQRFGDYLMLQITSLGTSEEETSTYAVHLNTDAPIIRLEPGNAPNTNGTYYFTEEDVEYEGKTTWEKRLVFPGVDLLPGDDRKVEMRGSLGNYPYSIGEAVGGIAQPAIDDKIVFGDGGGSSSTISNYTTGWTPYYQGSTYTTTTPPSTSYQGNTYTTPTPSTSTRPGMTVFIPFGLGHAVFDKIMIELERSHESELNRRH